MKKNQFIDYPLWHILKTPFMEKYCLIFSGNEGRKVFNKKVIEIYPEWVDDNDADGLFCEGYMYVEDICNNKHVLYHEIGHYISYVIESLDCQNEEEFKACLIQHILTSVTRALGDCID